MEDNRSKKKNIMKAGVIFVMILVLVFWLFILKNLFEKQKTEISQNKEELQSIREDLNQTVNKINEGIDKIKELDSATSTSATSTATTSNVNIVPVQEKQPIVLPQPEKTNSNCPSYINCMPTIGEVRACRIPVGCEEITQIAY